MLVLIKRYPVFHLDLQRWPAAELEPGLLLQEMQVQQLLPQAIAPPQRLQILVHPEPII